MSIAFSRSLRALNRDRDTGTLIALLAAVVLVIGWALWFFFAPITLYESTTDFTIGRDGLLAAQFSDAALARILPGQHGRLLPEAGAQPAFEETVALRVMDTPASTGRGDGLVYLYAPLSPIRATGTVQIAVEAVSPFTLILRQRSTPAPGDSLVPGGG
jgi:hypothetical protein